MKNQGGFATLLASVVLVLLVTISVFFGQKGSVIEQRVANNFYTTEQAFENAESGLVQFSQAIETELRKVANKNVDQLTADFLNVAKATATKVDGNYVLSFDNLSLVGSKTRVRLISTGASQNSSTTQKAVSKWLSFDPKGGSGPGALNTRGSAHLEGNATAESIESGKEVDKGHSDANISVTENSKKFMVSYLDSNGATAYRMMTSDEYFMYFFGALCESTKNSYDSKVAEGKIGEAVQLAKQCKEDVKSWVKGDALGHFCASDCGGKDATAALKVAYDNGKRWFWMDAGGMDHKIDMGTEDDPVVIFVMNIASGSTAAKINANSTIFGVLYVDVISSEVSCYCEANAKVVSLLSEAKTHYKVVDSGGTKCAAKSCTDQDGHTIDKNVRYIQETVTVTKPVWGEFSSPNLKGTNDAICTVTACVTDLSVASKSCTGGTAIDDTGTCEYISTAVTGATDQPVEFEIIGDWAGSGTGNTVVEGATITSGNYSGTGNVTFKNNLDVINKILEAGIGGEGLKTKRTFETSGWSDL